ncbi:MAG TPA: bacterial transcriptional activator domain-containing protein [Ktedonobacteraceae bacterium]
MRLSAVPSEPQRASLVAQFQHALTLVRGPFLDGFWLREETGFDVWVKQQQHQWQGRLLQLCDRLSSWQEAAGELEPVRATLTRWLELEPLAEEAARRLMRVHLARGDAVAALQVYAILRARLAEEVQAKPPADTVTLAEYVRATAAGSRGSRPAPSSPARVESQPPGEWVAPPVGRAAAFTQLVGRYQEARQGRPQAVLVVGSAKSVSRCASRGQTRFWGHLPTALIQVFLGRKAHHDREVIVCACTHVHICRLNRFLCPSMLLFLRCQSATALKTSWSWHHLITKRLPVSHQEVSRCNRHAGSCQKTFPLV